MLFEILIGDVIVFKYNPQLTTLNLSECRGVTGKFRERAVFERNLLAFFLGDISVFEFCPNVTDVILRGTKVSGRAHSLKVPLRPVFVSALSDVL